MIVAYCGNVEILNALVKEPNLHIDQKNNKGNTALLQATFNGHEEVVDILLRKNADPNAKSYRMQVNPLINAATEGHDKVVARLLKVKGTNVNATDLLGNTALMRAVESGNKESVAALLSRREIRISVKNKAGLNALMMAQKDKTEIRELLERAEEKALKPKKSVFTWFKSQRNDQSKN